LIPVKLSYIGWIFLYSDFDDKWIEGSAGNFFYINKLFSWASYSVASLDA